MTVDPRAATGFAGSAAAYERGRPSYPTEAIATVTRELGLDGRSTVLDLAAGTGKLTEVLLPLVERVIAVDPSVAMLGELRHKLPHVPAFTGTGEAIPLADGAIDAVFVAEAFHWFGTVAACREIARVLRPGGGLVLVWNRARWSERELPWLSAFDAVVRPLREAAGDFPVAGDAWADAVRKAERFAPLSSIEVEYAQTVDVHQLVDLVASWSWIANLEDDHRAAVLTEVRKLVDEHGALTLRYVTEVHWSRLA